MNSIFGERFQSFSPSRRWKIFEIALKITYSVSLWQRSFISLTNPIEEGIRSLLNV